MDAAYLKTTKRLGDVLPRHVLWLSNADMQRFFHISISTRKRDAEVLRFLQPKGFRSNWKNRKGYTREALEVWWEFYQLKLRFDRDEAISKIYELMEIIYEYQRQRTPRTA